MGRMARARAMCVLLVLGTVLLATCCAGATTDYEAGSILVMAAGAHGLHFDAYIRDMEGKTVDGLAADEKDRLLKAFRRLGGLPGMRLEGKGLKGIIYAGAPLPQSTWSAPTHGCKPSAEAGALGPGAYPGNVLGSLRW